LEALLEGHGSSQCVSVPAGLTGLQYARRSRHYHLGITGGKLLLDNRLAGATGLLRGGFPPRNDYEVPETIAWKRGYFRSGSKVGSIRSQPGVRKYGILSNGSIRSSAFSGSPARM
jgi:hypothetical protein